MYGAAFAEVYNRRWGGFARGVAPRLQAFYEALPVACRNRALLDLCCGTGQLARHFLDAGYLVTGLDASEAMLAWARHNAGEHVGAGRARFVRADVRDFEVGAGFGLVTCLYDSLNHLEDLEDLHRCFRCVRGAMDPEGVFVFDLNTRLGFRTRWNGLELLEGEQDFLVVRGVYDEGWDYAVMRVSGFVRREGGWERFEENFRERVFPCEDVLASLHAAGFLRAWPAAASDLRTPLEDPEAQDRVFIVAFAGAG